MTLIICYIFYLFIPCFSQANHRDMGEHRLVPKDEVVAFIQHLERQVSLMHLYDTKINETLLAHLCSALKTINLNFGLYFMLA